VRETAMPINLDSKVSARKLKKLKKIKKRQRKNDKRIKIKIEKGSVKKIRFTFDRERGEKKAEQAWRMGRDGRPMPRLRHKPSRSIAPCGER